jgi:8-hydroxy-5-deazaflavin:NADPH oxidoreductase
MDVTIVGAGNMGRGIGTRLVAGGNRIKILDHDPGQARELAEEIQGSAEAGGAAEGGAGDEPLIGDIVVLALPYPAVGERGDQLAGKIVVDITNPVDFESFDRLVTPAESSAAEELAKNVPADASVVKAFNTTFAATLVEGEVAGQPLDVFIAGDDEGAKATVAELARAGSLNTIDAGPLRRARELERLGFLHMAIQDKLGTGQTSAVKVIS